MMLTGKSITLEKGKQIGLIDKISNKENWQNHAKSLIKSKPKTQTASFLFNSLKAKACKIIEIGRASCRERV